MRIGVHKDLRRTVIRAPQLLHPAALQQALFDLFTADMVVTKQGIHLAGLHQLDKAQLDRLVPDPAQKGIELVVVEPLEQHRIDLHRFETGGQCCFDPSITSASLFSPVIW